MHGVLPLTEYLSMNVIDYKFMNDTGKDVSKKVHKGGNADTSVLTIMASQRIPRQAKANYCV